MSVIIGLKEERAAFAIWINIGDIVPGSGSCRKVRWSRKGKGKSGGLRVIYYNTRWKMEQSGCC